MSENTVMIEGVADCAIITIDGTTVFIRTEPTTDEDVRFRYSLEDIAAMRKFLSSPRFDKCKINLFVMRDGGRALPSDNEGV